MTDICFIALFTVFCTMGIYFFVKEITSALLKNRIKTKILLEVHNSDIDIEGQILISDKSENDEIGMILHKMSADNSCIILDNVKSSQK